jgi:hypothetical protein
VKWIKVDRTCRKQPPKGDYGDWKDQIAAECGYQCVYCALREGRFGGRRYGHIDHFRPKGLDKFKKLRTEIQNLYYACAVCNCFKSDDWPADPTNDHSVEAFIDPGDHDFNAIFQMSAASFEISSPHRAGAYIVEKLYLNRSHLLAERRLAVILEKMKRCCELLERTVVPLYDSKLPDTRKLISQVVGTLKALREAATALIEEVPYHSKDQKRPKRNPKSK